MPIIFPICLVGPSDKKASAFGIDELTQSSDITINDQSYTIKLSVSPGEKFKSAIPNFLKQQKGAFLIFEFSNEESFEKLSEYYALCKNAGLATKMILIGINNQDDEKIKRPKLQKFIEEHDGLPYIEIPLENKPAINELCQMLITKINSSHLPLRQEPDQSSPGVFRNVALRIFGGWTNYTPSTQTESSPSSKRNLS